MGPLNDSAAGIVYLLHVSHNFLIFLKITSRADLSGFFNFSSPVVSSPSERNVRSNDPSGVGLSLLFWHAFCAPFLASAKSSADIGARSMSGQPSAFQ